MASASGKQVAREIEELDRKEAEAAARLATLKKETSEAQQMLESIEKKKRGKVFAALDSFKKRYFKSLLGDKGVKVLAPKLSAVEEATLGKITTIPKIVNPNMREIEIQPILKNYYYVRILYDTMANE